MSREQRLELLQLARQAKAKKKAQRDAEKDANKEPVKRGRKKKVEVVDVVDEPMEVEPEPVINDDTNDDNFDIEPIKKTKPKVKKEKEPVRSLDLNNDVDVEDDIMVEEIVEVRKKPKKKIVKKIIYESDSEDEVEEVVVQKNKPKKEPAAKVKKVAKPVPLEQPREPEVKSSINFFNC